MVDTIGNITSATSVTDNASVSQDEFIRLFLAQLQFQDPLEPLNNREFLAQLAQFSVLEQARQSNESLSTLTSLGSSDQAIHVLGKEVEVAQENGSVYTGVVEGVHFNTHGITLTVKNGDGSFLDGLSLSQVRIVK